MMGRNHVIAGESTFVALAPLLTWADVHTSAGHPGSHGFFSWLEANSYGLLCHDWVTFLLGLFAFVFDTAGGVLFAKFLNLFRKKKINPMVGAAGISAFPMSARVIQKIAKEEDPYNFILMQSISANVSGQLGSIVAGGMVITLVSMMLGGIW